MKPSYSKQILPVPWLSLYRGSIVAGGNAWSSQGNPLMTALLASTKLSIPVDAVFLREILLQKCKSDIQ